jgi:hypothetical protein
MFTVMLNGYNILLLFFFVFFKLNLYLSYDYYEDKSMPLLSFVEEYIQAWSIRSLVCGYGKTTQK